MDVFLIPHDRTFEEGKGGTNVPELQLTTISDKRLRNILAFRKTQQQINIHNSCILNQVWLQQSRIGLSLYDISGLGYLREADLENYILEMIPTLPQVCNLVLTVFGFFYL